MDLSGIFIEGIRFIVVFVGVEFIVILFLFCM